MDMVKLDLLIEGGLVVDGTGGPPVRANVGVRGGRIAYIGSTSPEASLVIDAAGKHVAPGFIDTHTHYDAQLLWDPWARPQSGHGVTTYLCGNCGFSLAPITAASAEYLVPMLAKVEGIPLESLQAGAKLDWTSAAQMFERLEGNLGVNVGFMTGHSTLRVHVMGNRARYDKPTTDQLAEMKQLLKESLDAGSMGFSSSHAQTHMDHEAEGVPSLAADHVEICELMSVIRDYEGTTCGFVGSIQRMTPAEKRELAEISLASQRPFSWPSALPGTDSPERVEDKLSTSDVARSMGAEVRVQCPSTPFCQFLNLRNGVVYDTFPGIWNKLYKLPIKERIEQFKDPAVRVEMEKASAQIVAKKEQLEFGARWETMQIVSVRAPENKRYEGRLLKDIGEERGVTPLAALLDLAIADDLRTMFTQSDMIRTDAAKWTVITEALRDTRTIWAGDDGGAHTDQIELYSHSTRFLAGAVREFKVCSVEEAIHFFTQRPAEFMGLKDRGLLKEGYYADVVVFDLDRVKCRPVEMRDDFPAKGERLVTEAEGFDYVLVNGVPIIQHGEYTPALPGALLKAGRDTETVDIKRFATGAPEVVA
jgi:N-acyl-D-aspartate/D-glutamate deacylase